MPRGRWASGVLQGPCDAERLRRLDRAEGDFLRRQRYLRFLAVVCHHLSRARRDNLWFVLWTLASYPELSGDSFGETGSEAIYDEASNSDID